MKKTKTTLNVKGLRTPRLCLWIHGFFHGNILHTGGLDPETKTISSAYVTGQIGRFRNVCVERRALAEENLKKEWAEADQLLIELTNLTKTLSESSVLYEPADESSAHARARETVIKIHTARENEHLAIHKRLANIYNTICAEIHLAHDQMEATAEMLQSTFSAYGQGLLMKPVYVYNLPVVHYEDCIEHIFKNHENTWNAIISIVKEEK